MRERRRPAAGMHALGRRRLLAIAGPAAGALVVGGSARGMPAAVPIALGPTATADAFLDSLGVGTHWEQTESVYGRHADALADSVVRLGVRHVRGYKPGVSARLARRGVSSTLTAGPEVGAPGAIRDMLRRANANGRVIDTIEGPNEADLFWPLHGYTYRGQGFPSGVLAYQRDLFAAIKSAPDTARTLMIGPSLGRTYSPGGLANPFPPGSLAEYVDLGNFHPYPFGGNSFSTPFRYDGIARYVWNGNFPSDNLDQFPYQWQVYAPPFEPRPMAATETGYPTWDDGVTEAVQAKYIPRLFAEYFRLGIRRTYLYELVDDGHDPDGHEMDDHFGLIRNDLTPKPAFTALRGLTRLLAGARADITGPAPTITLAVRMPAGYDLTEYVHSLLLRIDDAQSVLLVWHEIADADTASKPPRSIVVPDGRVELTIASPYEAAAWYSYDADWQLRRQDVQSKAVTRLAVPLQDRLVAVKLRRKEPA